MIGPAYDAIRAHIEANYSTLPIKWQNEDWPSGTDPQAEGLPFIEIEIIGGNNRLVGFGTFGERTFVHPGLVRIYIAVPQASGMTEAVAVADVFAGFMERTEFGRTEGRAVRTLDFSTFGGTAASEDGAYTVLSCSCGFDWFYQG